jgi:hypothetical protein
METIVYFFGVLAGRKTGHDLWDVTRKYAKESALPASLFPLDMAWPHPRHLSAEEVRYDLSARNIDETNGRARIHFVSGWTVIAWWDQSADRRPLSNANFLMLGRHRWNQAIDLARRSFPAELARMEAAYAIELVGPDLAEDEDEATADKHLAAFHALHPNVQRLVLQRLGWVASGSR